MDAVDVAGLTKDFGPLRALDDVTLTVPRGTFFGLFGPNGAGKTTLVRILTGQLEPTVGTVRVLGLDPVTEPLRVKATVGVVPEVETPPSYLTGYEYLYFVARVRRLADPDARIRRWLDFLDLDADATTLCKDLSKGTRQKLMLAAALLHEPPVLFLDEPFINLDPIYQRRVQGHLRDYVGKGGTVFMCSHLLDMAEKLCDAVAVLNDGHVVAAGPLAAVRGDAPSLEAAFLRLVEGRR